MNTQERDAPASPATEAGPTAVVACPFCATLNRVKLARIADRPKCGQCGRPILLDRPLQATDANFERIVTNTEVPVLVDFYADWCGPCKIMAPVLDDVAHARQGKVLVLKFDTDKNPAMVARFGIKAIPTLIAFRKGRETGRATGAVPRAEVERLMEGAASQ